MVAVGEISRQTMSREELARIKAGTCSTKIRYTTRAEAEHERENMRRIHGPLDTYFLRVYGPCFFCGAYHLGNNREGRIGKRSLRRKMVMEQRVERREQAERKDTPGRRKARALAMVRRRAGV